MNAVSTLCHVRFLPLILAVSLLLCVPAHAAEKPAPATTEALVYSTMPSRAAHRPEMALDGDPSTYFQSAYGMGDGDEFLILLSRPIPLQSVRITTGNAEGDYLLTRAALETSPDGAHFRKSAAFNDQGVAEAALSGELVGAIRIRLDPGQGVSALAIREIAVSSPVKLSHVALGPGRGFVDVSQSPESAAWAAKAETQMERFWPDTAALLYSDGFITPNMVHVVYRSGPGVTEIAATGGGVMTVNPEWCRRHPDDTALTVHETAHVIQAFSAYNPVWLVEGIADYIRWVKFEPEHFHPRLNVQKSTYHDAYQTTAAFLAWCELHYDSALVTKLNRAVRFGTYKDDLFQKYCGKDVDALWAEFVAAYKVDPVNIITPPVAQADRPRLSPAFKEGSSVPVDLSSAFNTVGIFSDGKIVPGAAGVDAEGNGYSAALLSPKLTWIGPKFTLGPADGPDLVSCRGAVLNVPAGRYASLWLLGTAVEGAQMAQPFLVTYTDGSTETLAQNFSDWFQPQNFPGESRAVKMAYRNAANGARDARAFSVYSYGFSLNAAKTVQSVTLPSNDNVKILAVTLAN